MICNIVKHKNIQSLADDWQRIYSNNHSLTAFDSYLFAKNIAHDYIYRFKAAISPEFWSVSFDSQVKIIVPLSYNYKTKSYNLLHACNGSDYCNIVYDSNVSAQQMADCLWKLSIKLRNPLIISMLSGGVVSEALNILNIKPTLQIDNAIIKLNNYKSHQDYISHLSKNARQNLRTAYNRLNRDNLANSINISNKVDYSELKAIMGLYENRHTSRYGLSSNPLKSVYLKKYNYSTRSLFNSVEGLHARLYIDNTLAAFMSGYARDGRWIIPRLSINGRFCFYSPGIILIDKVIKWMYDNGFEILDLGLGTEPYKFQMGAEIFHSFNYLIHNDKDNASIINPR